MRLHCVRFCHNYGGTLNNCKYYLSGEVDEPKHEEQQSDDVTEQNEKFDG